jgi:hypothetical protein
MALCLLTLCGLPATSPCATFVVNSVQDGADMDSLDNVCDDGTGNCTLRAAIMQSNATQGADLIAFNIPGTLYHSITLTADLPSVSDPVVIDGYTQPGSSPNTRPFGQATNALIRIELNGGAVLDGLALAADGCTVRGLVINRCYRLPIIVFSNSNVIEGNFIGTDLSGTVALANGLSLTLATSHNRIGGPEPASRNIIGGNHGAGVFIDESAHDNLIEGNFIGTNAGGTSALPNQFGGIELRGSNNEVRSNLISGNISFSLGGIDLGGSDNVIEGNFIGTNVSGQLPLANDLAGISMAGSRNRIGGTSPGQGNIIAFNRGPGIRLQQAGLSNLISGNSIRLNDGLGIDMQRGGLPNDLGDEDTGANDLQNYPFLTLATTSGGIVSVSGLLASRPSTAYTLEFFSNTECDPSGYGEGRTYLGAWTVQTNESGNADFLASLNFSVPLGSLITATATDPYGNTSEFSACVALTAPEAGDHTPLVFAPGLIERDENEDISFGVWASDPDGDAITSLTMSPLPMGATFIPAADNASGLFTWKPGFDQAGVYDVTIAASSSPRAQPVSAPIQGSAIVHMVIANVDRVPIVTAPTELTVEAGSLLTFTISAADPDGDPIAELTAQNLPTGATFTTNTTLSAGTFTWTPGLGDAGVYHVDFFAYTPPFPGYATTTITVTHENLPPVADAGGPYSGVVGVPIEFDGTGSYDPEGRGIGFRWTFGDGGDAQDPIPRHSYLTEGVFQVTLSVFDGVLRGEDVTTAAIVGSFQARAFLPHGNRSIPLSQGSSPVCFKLEPVNGSYQSSDIDPSTVEMVSVGTGQVGLIPAVEGKNAPIDDSDGNGIEEITVCFRRQDMRLLFSSLSGRTTVTVAIEGRHVSGTIVRGELQMTIVVPDTPLGAAVVPNPLNPTAVLSFMTRKPGDVRARLFDTTGRLVRTLREGGWLPSGYHELPIDGRGSAGGRLSSGIYFYSIETAEGTARGRFAILK